MSKIKITVPKLHCERRTDILGKDEVYCALIVTTGNMEDLAQNSSTLPKVVFAKISPVNKKIKTGSIKSLDLGSAWIADIGDAEAFAVSFGLYEKDGGDIYRSLKEKLEKLPEQDNTSIKTLIAAVWDTIRKNIEQFSIIGLVESVIGVGVKIYQEFRKDDIIGDETFSLKSNDPAMFYPREYEMRGGNSKYHVQLAIEQAG